VGAGAAKLEAPTSRGEETGRKWAVCSAWVARRMGIAAPVTNDSGGKLGNVAIPRAIQDARAVKAHDSRGRQVEGKTRGFGVHGGSRNLLSE